MDNAKLMLGTAPSRRPMSSCIAKTPWRTSPSARPRSAQNIVDITRRRVAAGARYPARTAASRGPAAAGSRGARSGAGGGGTGGARTRRAYWAGCGSLCVDQAAGVESSMPALPVPTALPINLLARRPDVLAARAGRGGGRCAAAVRPRRVLSRHQFEGAGRHRRLRLEQPGAVERARLWRGSR